MGRGSGGGVLPHAHGRPPCPGNPCYQRLLADSCELSTLAGFTGAFVVALVLLSILIPLFSSAVQRSAIGGLDQALGFLFGVLRGALLVVVALIVYDRVLVGDPVPAVDDSRTAMIFAEVQETLADSIPDEAPSWIVDRYEDLVGECGAPASVTVEPETAPAAQ